MKIKKNDKAYLQDFKIDIQSEKDINYQELSIFFDKPAFLDMLPRLRNFYQITNLVSLEEYETYDFDTLLNPDDNYKIDISNYKKIAYLKETLPAFYEEVVNCTDFPLVLENECYLLCYEFNRPPYFCDVIRQAIHCGKVTESNFKSTKATVVESDALWVGANLPSIAIFISPTTTYEDVKEEFRNAKELMKTDERLSYYQPRIDIAPNIRKYREWYWEKIKGKTYEQISNEWEKKHNNEEDNTTYLEVLKGIKTYERLLAL